MFTRLSVHCALRMVATRSWKGDWKSSAQCASGYVRRSRSKISGARCVAGARREEGEREARGARLLVVAPSATPRDGLGPADEARGSSFGFFGEGRSFLLATFGRNCESGCRGGFRLLRMRQKLTPT